MFWVSVQNGAMAAGRDFNLEVLWNGPAQETEYSRQIQIVDSMVAQHVDGLAVAAAERQALAGSVERAIAAGIPVTIFDSGLDITDYMTYVATDNYAAGQMGARKLAELLHSRGQVAMMMHAPGSASTMDREQGFEDVIKAEYPGIRIVARQYGFSNPAKAQAAAENILTAHPDLDGIFASTEPESTGVSPVIKARGLSGKVRFVGFDASENMIEDLKAGTLDAIVVQDPYRIGYEAVRTLADKINGRTPPKRLDLSARVVTKADLDKPDVRKLLGK
jgi:ribose transport system substrate-binding protein